MGFGDPPDGSAERREGEGFPIRGWGSLELLETGIRWPRGRRRAGVLSYRDLTHVALTSRLLRVAGPRGAWSLPRARFDAPGAPAEALEAIRARVARLPDGPARLAHMERLDQRARSGSPGWVSRSIVVACLLVAVLQMLDPGATPAGALRLGLTFIEPWRAVTAHFFHGFVEQIGLLSPHLVLNLLCVWAVGGLVERVLGSPATVLVLAASAAGAVGASLLWAYPFVVGASGFVMGLLGVLLWLEFRAPAELPATWRLPRWLLVGVAALELVVVGSLPFVASAAHWGGVLGGGVTTAWVLRRPDRRFGLRVRALAIGLSVLTGLAFVALAGSLVAPSQAQLRRAQLLLERPDVAPDLLNDEAWTIAIADEPAASALALAQRMAERAVEATERGIPELLDTLAEIRFQQGHEGRAVALIEEAILLAPTDPYFREQRLRFLGERPREDRPEQLPRSPEAPRVPAPREVPRPQPEPDDGLLVRLTPTGAEPRLARSPGRPGSTG